MKTKITGIYKIINILNNKIYIGSSNNILRRWKEHKKYPKRYPTYIQSSITKHGVENFKFDIIEECKFEQLKERETFWCNYYNSFDRNLGYNVDMPIAPRLHNETTKEKLRNINLNKKHTDETKMKCYLAAKRRDKNGKMSEEHKNKISQALKGIPKTKEATLKRIATKIKNGTLAPTFTNEYLIFLSEKNSGCGNFNFGKPSVNRRKIDKICPITLNVIKIYDTIKDTATENNSYTSNIVKCCQKNKEILKYKVGLYYYRYHVE